MSPYSPPLVEQWVSDTFIHAGILYPSDIRADKLCRAFGVEYGGHYGIAGAKIIGHVSYIAVDSRIKYPEQHEQFLHELGHILRHYGDQTNMPKSMREYQEWDANLFAMYAAVPFHMIDFSRPYTVWSLMNDFTITEAMAAKRIRDIRAKIYWESRRKYEEMVCEPAPPAYDLSKKSPETQRIMNQLKNQLERKDERLEIHDLL